MLKTIKKSFFLSLFAYSFVSPMRQIARVALARPLNQMTSFHNSLAARCPLLTAAAIIHMAAEATKTDESIDDPIAKHHQDAANDNRGLVADLNQNENTEWSAHQHQHQEQVATNWQRPSSSGVVHNRVLNHIEAQQRQYALCMAAFRVKLEQQEQTCLTHAKSELYSRIANFAPTVQHKAHKLINSYSSLSHREIIAERENRAKDLPALKNELIAQTRQNPLASFVVDATAQGFDSQSVPYHVLDKCTTKDAHEVSRALELTAEIEAKKVAIQECDRIIHRFEQEERDFESTLKSASSEKIEKKILPGLMANKEAIAVCISQKENELVDQSNKHKAINVQLELFSKRSAWTKCKEFFKQNNTKELLIDGQHAIQADRRNTLHQLHVLHNKEKECNALIERVQNVVDEKRQIELQETRLAQAKLEQEALQKQHEQQEALIFAEQMLKNQYESCNFDSADCPEHELRKQWFERQQALSATIDQGYKQYGQEFHLTPQTVGFLAVHDLKQTDYQYFFGTALQQQLHSEMCNALSQAAILHMQFPYQQKLLTSVVDFADAAYDANKKEQVLLASRLMDVDWIGLKLSRQILAEAMPYAQSILSGAAHSAIDFLHMAAHPIETCKELGKTICFALETAALNCVDDESMAPEIYRLKRDQRNEEVAQALQQLGDQMANSTGPERLEALTRFGTDFVVPGKIIHAVGGVCGAIRSQANILRTFESVAPILAEGLEFEKSTQELILATEKLEVAAQESIAKSVAAELMEAEKNFEKSTKVTSSHGAEIIKQSRATQELETVLQKSLNAIEDILKETTPGDITTGKAKQYIKKGFYEDAIKDFYSLKPSNVKKIPEKEGLHGILPDGRSVNVRLESTCKKAPTIEIMKPGGGGTRIKIRYENKL